MCTKILALPHTQIAKGEGEDEFESTKSGGTSKGKTNSGPGRHLEPDHTVQTKEKKRQRNNAEIKRRQRNNAEIKIYAWYLPLSVP